MHVYPPCCCVQDANGKTAREEALRKKMEERKNWKLEFWADEGSRDHMVSRYDRQLALSRQSLARTTPPS